MQHGLVVEPRRGHVKPFRQWREIRRGKNRGRYEVAVPNYRTRHIIVDADAVRRWPGKGGES